MIYELRTYWAAPGKLEALHTRFQTLTLGLFERYGIKVLGFWTPAATTEETGDLVYLVACTDQQALEQAWAAFRVDPDWIAGRAASEIHGALVSKVVSTILQPTPYSELT